MKKTKIVCTIGPASSDKYMMKAMILAGMNAMRLNFSHGTHEEHKKQIDMMKAVSDELGEHIAIILDTKGPEIRTGIFGEKEVLIETGAEFTLTPEDVVGNTQRCSISYKDLAKDVSKGQKILIDDGLIELEVIEIIGKDLKCIALNNGILKSNKGINVPGIKISLPALTEKDIKDLLFGIENGVDFIAASFVRKASDVLEIRKILEGNNAAEIRIISKIENQEGVDNLLDIISVSDGIMVARGDLGVEILPEKIPLIQKMIIRECNKVGKPVITATQMLDSMIRNPRPTRAEVADVANAILDGTDAIMLSGETAAGSYPLEAVEIMCDIALTIEESLNYDEILEGKHKYKALDITNAIGFATCTTANDLKAAAIVTATSSGYAAQMVSKFRPKAPIIASTNNETTARRLAITWGAYPIIIPQGNQEDEIYRESIEKSVKSGLIREDDLVIFTAGFPFGKSGTTNMMKVHRQKGTE